MEDQTKLAKDELETRIQEIEQRFQRYINQELDEIKSQLTNIATSTAKLQGELVDKWNILVVLRSHSFDKLLSEYKKVEEKIILDRKGSEELISSECDFKRLDDGTS